MSSIANNYSILDIHKTIGTLLSIYNIICINVLTLYVYTYLYIIMKNMKNIIDSFINT